MTAELSTIFLVLFSMSVVFWFIIGRFRLHNALINMYVSFAILQVVPDNIVSFNKFTSVVLFLFLVIFLTFIDKGLFEIHLTGSGLAIWQVIVLSFLEAGLLVSIILALVPKKEILVYISPGTLDYFISSMYEFFWMVAPLLFLTLIKKR